MPSERVLIVGAGVAGSILAFYLAKHDYRVLVIERSKVSQKLGQGIEIEPPAVEVVERMGIMDKLQARKTGEAGTVVVDQQARRLARFGVENIGLTGALEMMRGDLTEILYEAANESPNVSYRFETTIKGLQQKGDRVIVEIENRRDKTSTSEEFDFVIGADGVKSRTREMVLGSPEKLNCYHSINVRAAYFSIPKEDQDWPDSRICHIPGGRVVWIRPVGKDSKVTSVYLIHVGNQDPELHQANVDYDRKKQKEIFARTYSGLGWETRRVIEHMMEAENFYSDEFMQVKLPKWSEGRVAFLGDSAWAPTPITGEGNQLAIIGAWVLAQEMSRDRTPAAFQNYENRFRPYVENAQTIALGGYAPRIFGPHSILGIFLLRTFLCIFSWGLHLYAWAFPSSEQPDHHPAFDLEAEQDEKPSLK